ncbi:hypothetical protein N321_14121, partial [Antrostomus carolinensis]
RLCHWVLLKLLNCFFLNLQLHQGQVEMVLKATKMADVPLVFLSTHKSQLDGLLLSFLLFSQGLGVPRVMVGNQLCSPRLRALLSHLGGIFLPLRMEQRPSEQDEELLRAVLATYIEELLRSHQPLLIFLEEPPIPMCLSASAREWLTLVSRAVQDGSVPDVLLVPSPTSSWSPSASPTTCSPVVCTSKECLGSCLWAACRALRQNFGCARVDFGQPFSFQEFAAKNFIRKSCSEEPPEELMLLPTILGTCLEGKKGEIWSPGTTTTTNVEAEEEMLVTKLGLHCLSEFIPNHLFILLFLQGVFFSRLMLDFSWLLEEILLRRHDVCFSGQLRVLVQHSVTLLKSHLTFYSVTNIGDILVVPKDSAEALRELNHYSAAILPVFASEAVGACAIHALLVEVLPFLRESVRPSDIVLSQDELHRKILELLRLLPPNLLGFQPCQPLDCRSQDIMDKLLQCGLLEYEE